MVVSFLKNGERAASAARPWKDPEVNLGGACWPRGRSIMPASVAPPPPAPPPVFPPRWPRHHHHHHHPPVRVALCVAGAVRDFERSWPSVQHNVVNPTGAHVYLVVGHEKSATAGVKRRGAPVTPGDLDRLRSLIGVDLKGAASFDDDDMAPRSLAHWAGAEVANAANTTVIYSWRYYLKRWACHALMADSSEGPYEVVVTMRPDLYAFRPWRIENVPRSHGHGGTPRYRVAVGHDGEPVEFGEHEVVLHAFTLSCVNDWISVSTFNASTTLEQLAHHLYSSKAFAPCTPLVGHASICCEKLMGSYLWRTNLTRQLTNLHVEMTRKLGAVNGSDATSYTEGSNRSSWFDHKSVRTNSRNGSIAKAPLGNWQYFCEDPAFADFADTPVRDSCANDFSAATWTGKGSGPFGCVCIANLSLPGPGTCGGGADLGLYPPCADADLRRPLPPCLRTSIRQRVAADGYAAYFPWWESCPKETGCKPLPNAFYYSASGTAAAACAYPARKQPGGLERLGRSECGAVAL